MIFESVINISAGDELGALALIKKSVSSQKSLIDIHSDIDHNRSVFTFASKNLDEVMRDAHSLISSSFECLDISSHNGVHPRIGVVDVIPFVIYDEEIGIIDITSQYKFIDEVKHFANEIYSTFKVPIFFYDFINEEAVRTLPEIRKHAFKGILPNIGMSKPHNRYGAIALGIRQPLVAINVDIMTNDLLAAKAIAKQMRESSGGIAGVRALGLPISSQEKVQVSMNIVDLDKVNAGDVCIRVKNIASDLGFESSVELVGMIPKFHFDQLSKEFLDWSKLDSSCIIENKI